MTNPEMQVMQQLLGEVIKLREDVSVRDESGEIGRLRNSLEEANNALGEVCNDKMEAMDKLGKAEYDRDCLEHKLATSQGLLRMSQEGLDKAKEANAKLEKRCVELVGERDAARRECEKVANEKEEMISIFRSERESYCKHIRELESKLQSVMDLAVMRSDTESVAVGPFMTSGEYGVCDGEGNKLDWESVADALNAVDLMQKGVNR